MVLGVRLVKEDVKEPVPVPSVVFVERAIVGFVVVDQTTPLAVKEAPPSDVILPPEVAEVDVIAVMAMVVSDGIETMEFESFRQRTEAPNDLLPVPLSKLPLLRDMPRFQAVRSTSSVALQKKA